MPVNNYSFSGGRILNLGVSAGQIAAATGTPVPKMAMKEVSSPEAQSGKSAGRNLAVFRPNLDAPATKAIAEKETQPVLDQPHTAPVRHGCGGSAGGFTKAGARQCRTPRRRPGPVSTAAVLTRRLRAWPRRWPRPPCRQSEGRLCATRATRDASRRRAVRRPRSGIRLTANAASPPRHPCRGARRLIPRRRAMRRATARRPTKGCRTTYRVTARPPPNRPTARPPQRRPTARHRLRQRQRKITAAAGRAAREAARPDRSSQLVEDLQMNLSDQPAPFAADPIDGQEEKDGAAPPRIAPEPDALFDGTGLGAGVKSA